MYLAARHPDAAKASAVFLIAGRGVVDAHGLRRHLLNPQALFVRLFTAEPRARRWAQGLGPLKAELSPAPPPAPLPPTAPSTVRVFFSGGDRLVDLDNAASTCDFFRDVHKDQSLVGSECAPFGESPT